VKSDFLDRIASELTESGDTVLNIAHFRCGPVGVRFIESRFAGRHKCRPYKDLKRKFLYYQDIKNKYGR